MWCRLFVTLLVLVHASESKTFSEKIKHVVVLMLENRSFDHMLGFMSAKRDDIDGCVPSMGDKCSCPMDPQDPNSEKVYISNDAIYEQPADPQHSLAEITYQIYGTNSLGNMIDLRTPSAPMNGFIKSYSQVVGEGNGSFIMRSYDENTLPVLTKLANEFGVIDHWFAGIPGETQPNRIMAMRGHTNGFIRNSDITRLVKGFDGLNIFSMFDEYYDTRIFKEPWNIFAGDVPNALWLKSVRRYPRRFHRMETFYEKVSTGRLPLFSWVEPAYFDINCSIRSTSEHANQHDVRNGEMLIKRMYETLRVSPIWNETLFFIYFDEHGGFWDHVSPPSAPNPDGVNSVETDYPYGPPFDFKRLGVRIPVVLVSPWIKKGTVDPNIAQNGESQYCHSSLIHTLRNAYIPNCPSLSKRDEWSLTFEHLLNSDTPRTDTPLTLDSIALKSMEQCLSEPGRFDRFNVTDVHISATELIANAVDKLEEVKDYISSQPILGKFAINLFKQWIKSKRNSDDSLRTEL